MPFPRGLFAILLLGISCLGCSARSQPAVNVSPAVPSAEQWLRLGQRLAQQGNVARAEEYLLAAWAEGASPRTVLTLLLPMCISEGRLRTALEYATRARRSDPQDPRLLQISISLQLALGHTALARREMDALATLGPQYQEAIYFLGEQFYQLGQPLRAQVYLEQYLQTWPQAPDAAWVIHMLTRIAQERDGATAVSTQTAASTVAVAASETVLPQTGEK